MTESGLYAAELSIRESHAFFGARAATKDVAVIDVLAFLDWERWRRVEGYPPAYTFDVHGWIIRASVAACGCPVVHAVKRMDMEDWIAAAIREADAADGSGFLAALRKRVPWCAHE